MIRFCLIFFFFNDTATTEIYTLSLHDALPICLPDERWPARDELIAQHAHRVEVGAMIDVRVGGRLLGRSEEHTSELQSRSDLVCRLLLEKKKKTTLPQLVQHYRTQISRLLRNS